MITTASTAGHVISPSARFSTPSAPSLNARAGVCAGVRGRSRHAHLAKPGGGESSARHPQQRRWEAAGMDAGATATRAGGPRDARWLDQRNRRRARTIRRIDSCVHLGHRATRRTRGRTSLGATLRQSRPRLAALRLHEERAAPRSASPRSSCGGRCRGSDRRRRSVRQGANGTRLLRLDALALHESRSATKAARRAAGQVVVTRLPATARAASAARFLPRLGGGPHGRESERPATHQPNPTRPPPTDTSGRPPSLRVQVLLCRRAA
jgi:hypothetical protein